ncbi:surface antigen BspA-like [Trichomonas vaginalis G3]|uniref:Surface antigen BspA-like n=1 Tax=Trichomonas vaginalis (strain ATCC PRA-98 / G3) TaxID=412133 RepID=A2FWJ2_TRIV3|nr:surface antigen family [Trichomonas vaginalis G3]EAX90731.1 surface antigen BspA-like [Trichomonas vaginalis G3]KAI5507430.1 surface antigen family [Trichomonas vaginalis G3]|eukprot:XP_001303661.1 surface antigen BspA-like [Trichomonas vaginalis G3]
MSVLLALLYTNIAQTSYSEDGKILTYVTDSSPYLRISAKCEIIQDYCFKQLNSLISFSFEYNPNLITIGYQSFYECMNLSSINLSPCTRLIKISGYAFYGCENVSEILLPKGLVTIEHNVFSSNKLLTTIIIPASLEKLGGSTFNVCLKLANVIIEEGSKLTSLESAVFWGINITSFQIPEKVTKVNGIALDDKIGNLTIHPNNAHLKLENGMILSADKSILFYVCDKTSEIFTIPNYVSILGDSCLYGSNIASISFPSSVTTIGSNCFSNSKLITITIPKNIKRIEACAFFSCDYLINVKFSEPLDYIGGQAFDYCKKLELFIFPDSPMIVNAIFITMNSLKASMSFTCKCFFAYYAIKRNTNVSVSYLGQSNLIMDTNALVMDSEQTYIYEFWGCNFKSLVIPKSVTKIKTKAFENSDIPYINLTTDSLLNEIENYAFRNCSKLVLLNFSSNRLKTIGIESFKDCISLTSVSFASPNLVVKKNAFENCKSLVDLNSISDIPDYLFRGCQSLRNINILDNSIFIGYKSFENCYSLESIRIPSSIRTISEYSFMNCNRLSSIKISEINNLEKISNNSFSGCSSLQSISNFESAKYKCIDNTLYYKNETGEYLMYHAINSLDRTLFINCKVICSYSFNKCNNINNISITSDSVSLIEKYAFNNCKNLNYINFPNSVETVESFAFNECPSIRCPLIIENKSVEYIKMIIESGISPRLLVKCHVVHGSNKLNALRSICNTSARLFWKHMGK